MTGETMPDSGLPPVGDALGPVTDEPAQTVIKEVVLGAGGPVGKDSTAPLPTTTTTTPATTTTEPPAKRKRGPTNGTKRRQAAPPPPPPVAVAPDKPVCKVKMQLTVKKGDKTYAILVNTGLRSMEAVQLAFGKWAAQVERVWAKL